MHVLITAGMERKQQTISRLLLACILLATSAQHQCFITVMVPAIDSSVDVQLGTKQPEHQLTAIKYASALTDKRRQEYQEMKKQRVPSGPSPIGNRHPPVRP